MLSEQTLYYISCILAAGFTFTVSYCQDRNSRTRPDWRFRLISSITAAYLSYFYWPKPKEFEVFNFFPFPTIQLWLGFCSYAGIYIFRHLHIILKKGPREWAGIWAERLQAYSKDKNK